MKIFALILLIQLITNEISALDTLKEKISKYSFADFLRKVENAAPEEKQNLVEDFISTAVNSGYPLFEDDSTVVLLYKGNTDSVYLIGDMTDWDHFLPMQKINGTDLFYFKGIYEPTARLEYWFIITKDGFPFTDPMNKYKSVNGLGELSVLAMPAYSHHPIFKDYEEGEKGNYEGLQEYEISSKYLNYDHTIHIYLPPGYSENENYPVVYFQDGKDYIQCALAPHILNELIKSKKIKPVIAIFVTPPNLHQPKMPNRMTEYGMNEDYVKFFVQELVIFTDEKFSALRNPEGRLVVGDSYGGLISTYIAFTYPEVFQNVYSQSGYHSFDKDKMIRMIKSSDKKTARFYIDIGTYERKVGASFLPIEETDFLEGNRRLKKALEEKEYDFIYKEYYEGHTWGNWRRHLIDALIYFFGNKEKL